MKKIYFLAIILLSLNFLCAGLSQAAENNLAVTNNEAVGATVYPSQWDIEALDFSLAPAADDTLNALTIKNYGLASDVYFEKVILYADDGDGVFEGWKRDTEVGAGVYYDQNKIWYWKDLNVAVPKAGQRFFVAFETKSNGNITVDRRTIQAGIPSLYDENSNGIFDFTTDTGIFMSSKNNAPASGILNSAPQTIYKTNFDSLPPRSVVIYPASGGKISENNIIITGASRDQGGSTPSSVQINISKVGAENANWSDVAAAAANYSEWKYNWNNIEDGTYMIKVKAADWIGNIGEEAGITVTVDSNPLPSLSPTPTPISTESPTPTPLPTVSPTPTPLAPSGVEGANVSDGDLVRASGDYKVYVVKGNYRRWILSAEIFKFYPHFSFSAVKEITKQGLESYRESWLIRADGDAKVYEINGDGSKHWINISAQKFSESGRLWDMVYIVNSRERDFYKTGADII